MCRTVRALYSSQFHIEFTYQNRFDLKTHKFCFNFSSIEHLWPETEQNMIQNIFGFIYPKIAVFTTPNADFNVLFGQSKFPNGFRHDDHKFEWTQQQFQDWLTLLIFLYI